MVKSGNIYYVMGTFPWLFNAYFDRLLIGNNSSIFCIFFKSVIHLVTGQFLFSKCYNPLCSITDFLHCAFLLEFKLL
jgi:hypothetical protein